MKPISVLRAFFAFAIPAAAWAQAGLPAGANVVAGTATIATTANSMTVTTGSPRTIIDYSGFSVGAGNSVRFDQPSSSSATLNRVISTEGSSILGSVSSNGQIFLVNPNGIFVGPGGSFSGSSVYLSTGNISNADFLAENIRFDPPPAGSQIMFNGGTIDATDHIQFNSAERYPMSGPSGANAPSIDLGPGGPIRLVVVDLGPVVYGPPTASGSGGSVYGGDVVTTAGTISTSATGNLTLTGGTFTTSGWTTFSLAAGESTHFAQTSASATVLNRVLGDPVQISGTLTSNGKVWLVPPAGNLVSPSSVVSTDGLKLAPVSVQAPNLMDAPLSRPVSLPSSIPRGTSGLVDGTVTVRLSLVDPAPISLR
jgi:filamentous hemagglutinin family protein